MSVEPVEDPCRLCPTVASALCEPAVMCFDTVPIVTNNSCIKYTFVEILNKHFWFELRSDRDANAFVCQPCWRKVIDFHQFYQSVLVLYESRGWPPDSGGNAADDKLSVMMLTRNAKTTTTELVIKYSDNENDAEANDASLDDDEDEDYVDDSNRTLVDCKDRPSIPIEEQTKRKRGRPRKSQPVCTIAKTSVKDEPTVTLALIDCRDNVADSSMPHKCGDCSKTYTSLKRLDTHRRLKHAAEKSVDSEAHIESDQQRITNSDSSRGQQRNDEELLHRYMQMVCHECGVPYASFADAKRHQEQAHGRYGYVECCDRKFSTKGRAVQHCLWHENPRQFDCTICSQNLQSTRSLQDHIARMHPSPTAFGYQCDQCERHYAQLAQLRDHLRRVHTPLDECRFECFHCHRRYAYLSALRKHMQSHDPVASHVCDVCAKQFRTKATYELHYALEHGATRPSKKQCPVCQRWLKHANMLSRHMLLHRGQPGTCADCGHRAPNARALYAHRHKMHRAKRHQCMACGKWFRVLQALREHMAIHAGITDLYTCAYCPKTFRSDSNMYKHRRQVHAEQYEADRRVTALATEERNRAEAAAAEMAEANALRTKLGLGSN